MLGLVRSAKGALFPNGYPGPPRADPPPEEQAALYDQLQRCIEARVPCESSISDVLGRRRADWVGYDACYPPWGTYFQGS